MDTYKPKIFSEVRSIQILQMYVWNVKTFIRKKIQCLYVA